MKTWVVSKHHDIDEANCELCLTRLQMSYEVATKCSYSAMCEEGMMNILFIPLLFIILGILLGVLYLLALKYIETPVGASNRIYDLMLILVCLISVAVIGVLMYYSMKDTCCASLVVDWHIVSQNFPEMEGAKIEDIQDNTRLESNWIDKGIMILPSSIRARGKKVRLPEISPRNFTIVKKRGKTVAYLTRRGMSYSASREGLDRFDELHNSRSLRSVVLGLSA